MNEHQILFLSAWLGTGTVGLILGVIGVSIAKRRLRGEPAATLATSDDALAAEP